MNYPIRRIVAGIAGMDDGDPLFTSAVSLAVRASAELHLVHAYDLPPAAAISRALPDLVNGEAIDAFERAVRQRLEGLARARGVAAARAYACATLPPAALLDVAARADADLIVVGATRHRLLVRLFLGSTSQCVLRHATVPVLVVRRPLPERARRVLLATDLSEFSAAVHEVGLDVVESVYGRDEPELRAVHVERVAGALSTPESAEGVRRGSRASLDGFLAVRRPRSRPVGAVVRSGHPAAEILAEVDEWKPDLLIVGRHETGGRPARIPAGPAEAAARDASCNVLVVPAPMSDERLQPIQWTTPEAGPEPRAG